MVKNIILILSITLSLSSYAYSQELQRRMGGTIIGFVYDDATQNPISYANIVLYNASDSAQITGTITNDNGEFELSKVRPGNYYVEIYFIGYGMKRIVDIRLARGNMVANLNDIYISPTQLTTDEIEVTGERPAISYQIDKKVIDVDKFDTSISGNALDVLENIPSISVDIDGNVSLRGSGNFTLLIDGRPSILDPSDALEQIPSSTIDQIEIITNPSVKYDPEGTSGIMNIILKKERRSGSSGMINLNGGLNDKYGGDILMDYQNGKYHTTLSLDYNKRYMTGEGKRRNTTIYDNVTSNVSSEQNSVRGRISKGVRTEMEILITPNNILNIGGRYGDRTSENNSDADFIQWSDSEDPINYTNESNSDRSGNMYSLFSGYRHNFKKKGHQLYGEIFYRYRDGDEVSKDELLDSDQRITSGRITTEKGPSSGIRAKLEYTLPLNKDDKFEAGYQANLDYSTDETGFSEFIDTLGQYVNQFQFDNSTDYDKKIQAAYALYSGMINKFGYQLGLRGEYTYRVITYNAEPNSFKIDRWDYFPTFHTSYEFLQNQRLMASYTRRIHRPRGWQLEPFETWMDAYNVRRGNPAIKPEYIDSYELGYQTNIGKTLFSTEIYYRITNDKVEHIHGVYGDNISLHTFDNVGKDYAFGSELLFNFDVVKSWSINLMGNLYYYLIEGTLDDGSYSNDSFDWRTRLSNNIKLGKSTQFQIDGRYNSASVSSQGKEEANYSVNVAVKHEIINKKLSATLQIRDIFATSHRERTSEGRNFYSYMYREREAPLVMLNLRLRLNNYKAERRERDRDEMNGDEGEGDF